MKHGTARLCCSDDDLEAIVSELWLVLERNGLPTPRLSFVRGAAGMTIIELRLGVETKRAEALRVWLEKNHHRFPSSTGTAGS